MEKFKKGKKAMETLDKARVKFLRRHGFAAELVTTDKFPKGDVIIARRLPNNFEAKLDELEKLEKEDPVRFDQTMLRLDKLANGGDVRGMRATFGEGWVDEDYRELTKHFETKLEETSAEAEVKKPDQKTEAEQFEKQVFGMKLSEYMQKLLGKVDGKTFGKALQLAKKIISESKSKSPEEIKDEVGKIAELYK